MMEEKRTLWGEFSKGFITTNPLLVLMVGLCSALAISTRVESCIFMGLAVIFVLTCSNTLISLIRKIIPDEIRIPIYIVVIASFVTIVDLTLKTMPAIYERLGVWIPLIVVNCIILARAEGYASDAKVSHAAMDGLGIGLGYTVVLLILGVFRELLGTGKIVMFNRTLVNLGIKNLPVVLILFPGAFISYALLAAGLNWYQERKAVLEIPKPLPEGLPEGAYAYETYRRGGPSPEPPDETKELSIDE